MEASWDVKTVTLALLVGSEAGMGSSPFQTDNGREAGSVMILAAAGLDDQ